MFDAEGFWWRFQCRLTLRRWVAWAQVSLHIIRFWGQCEQSAMAAAPGVCLCLGLADRLEPEWAELSAEFWSLAVVCDQCVHREDWHRSLQWSSRGWNFRYPWACWQWNGFSHRGVWLHRQPFGWDATGAGLQCQSVWQLGDWEPAVPELAPSSLAVYLRRHHGHRGNEACAEKSFECWNCNATAWKVLHLESYLDAFAKERAVSTRLTRHLWFASICRKNGIQLVLSPQTSMLWSSMVFTSGGRWLVSAVCFTWVRPAKCCLPWRTPRWAPSTSREIRLEPVES